MLNGIVQEWQREGRAPATINKFVATLRRAFRLGRLNKKVRVLPDFPEKLAEHNARQGFAEWGTVLAGGDAQHSPKFTGQAAASGARLPGTSRRCAG
jgi:hypothetical protein